MAENFLSQGDEYYYIKGIKDVNYKSNSNCVIFNVF